MTRENRSHVRIKVDSTVFVEVIARTANSEALLLKCDVVDVSYGGFCVCIKRELTVGAILPICAELPGSETPFYLAAEVKWCRTNTDGRSGWLAGFQLFNSSDTDIKLWRSLLLSPSDLSSRQNVD